MVASGAVVAGLAVGLVYPMIFEDQFLYYPDRELRAKPSDFGLRHEDVWLRAGNDRVHAWLLRGRGRALLVFFHGNAGTIADRLDQAARFVAHGLDVLLVEHPGYGRSEGEPSEASLTAAADAALDWARKRPRKVILFGESLGGAVAIDLASRRPVEALITQSTFTSIADMAKAVFPWLPFTPPLRNRFESINKIGRIAAPKLLLHGDADELVPYAQGKRLFEAARDPRRFVTLKGATHNDTWVVREKEYFAAFDAFLRYHGL